MDMENKKEEAMLMVCPLRLYVYINSLSIPCAPLYLNFNKSLHLHCVTTHRYLLSTILILSYTDIHLGISLYTLQPTLTCKYFVDAEQSTGYFLQQTNLRSGSHRENEVPTMPPHRLFN
jgi:hypothetical protein